MPSTRTAAALIATTLVAACSNGNTNAKTKITSIDNGNDSGIDAGASSWPVEFGSTTEDEYGRALATDTAGNVYVVGQLAGSEQTLIAKYDPTGKKLWETTYADTCNAIAVDTPHGAVYLGCAKVGSPAAIGAPELVELDLSGTLKSTQVLQPTMVPNTPTQTIGGAATAIGVDPAGDVILAGLSDSPIMTATTAAPGEADFFVAKYDASGALKWVTMLGTGTTNQDTAEMAVTGDALGNVYFGAETTGAIGGATFAGGSGDLLAVKLDGATGKAVWIHDDGGAGEDAAWGVAVDGKNDVYFAGFSDSTLDGNTNAGDKDVIVQKYDSTGSKLWAQEIGGPGIDVGIGLGLDATGLPTVGGTTDDNFDGHMNSDETSGGGISNAIAVKFDASGKKLWSNEYGTDNGEDVDGVAVDGQGNAFLTGGASDDLGTNKNTGKQDVYILRFLANGQM
jgi:hypothetical protein